MENDKSKIRKYKIIFFIIMCLTICIAILVGFLCTCDFKESIKKYIKEKKTTTQAVQNTVTVTIDGKVPTIIPVIGEATSVEYVTIPSITDETVTIPSITDEMVIVPSITDELVTTPSASQTDITHTTEVLQTTMAVQPSTGISTGEYTAVLKSVNSWEGHCQYELTVSNISDININSWKVSIKLPAGCNIINSWNCVSKIENNTLTVTPVDYNSSIAAGQNINNVGIIISGNNLPLSAEANGTASGNATSDNNNLQQEPNTTVPDKTDTNYDSYIPPKQESGTPLSNHGKLAVKGTDLVDSKGNKFQLKGVSTHGLGWFPQYVNKEAFRTLRDDWGANAVRLALYTAEGEGYCNGHNHKDKVEKGVAYATELGMYVIIDWHILSDGNPHTNKAYAIEFFSEMAQKYKDYSNVIYEICNEPNGGVDWAAVKSYADEIIDVIRKYDADAIILVGTPTWSQEVDKVAAAPVAKPYNVMYVLHFYAATHKEDLRNRLKSAIAAGTPVFISEFSICDASGNGGIDYESANAWKELINSYNISYIGWSLCNKAETASLINSNCSKTSGWTTSDLSETGKWLRNFIAGY